MIPVHIKICEAPSQEDAAGLIAALMSQFATIPDVKWGTDFYTSRSLIFLLSNL